MPIAVIIPTLNEAAGVQASIDSAWTAGADQVIVVDGGSSDDTVNLAAGKASQVLITSRGRGHQQNVGAAAANVDWLLFLHADNRLGEGATGQLREIAGRQSIGCGAFRQRIEAKGFLYRMLEQGNALRVKWWGMPYGDQAIFVRRDLFQAIGGFPEVPLMEDYILMRALRHKAWPVLLDGPVYVSARRWRKIGVIRQTVKNWTIVARYRLGASPERLARLYYGSSPRCNLQAPDQQPTAAPRTGRDV